MQWDTSRYSGKRHTPAAAVTLVIPTIGGGGVVKELRRWLRRKKRGSRRRRDGEAEAVELVQGSLSFFFFPRLQHYGERAVGDSRNQTRESCCSLLLFKRRRMGCCLCEDATAVE